MLSEFTVKKQGLGTNITLEVVTSAPRSEFDQTAEKIFGRIIEIEERFSRFLVGSELSQVNRQAGQVIAVSDEFLEVLKCSLAFARESNGIFDPTILPALIAEGYGEDFERLEKSQSSTPSHVLASRYQDISINTLAHTISLPEKIGLDLGGSVKGYAVDEVTKLLTKKYENFFINAGGDMFLRGKNLRGKSWKVGVEKPDNSGELLAMLAVTDRAVATSGGYKRKWQVGAKTKHHIIDPRTGKSVNNDTASVTVIADTVEKADKIATAIFVLGKQKGLEFATRRNTECLIITQDGGLTFTAGMQQYILN